MLVNELFWKIFSISSYIIILGLLVSAVIYFIIKIKKNSFLLSVLFGAIGVPALIFGLGFSYHLINNKLEKTEVFIVNDNGKEPTHKKYMLLNSMKYKLKNKETVILKPSQRELIINNTSVDLFLDRIEYVAVGKDIAESKRLESGVLTEILPYSVFGEDIEKLKFEVLKRELKKAIEKNKDYLHGLNNTPNYIYQRNLFDNFHIEFFGYGKYGPPEKMKIKTIGDVEYLVYFWLRW